MNLGTHLWGVSIYDHILGILETLILVAIILEGPWYARKQKEVTKAFRKFMRDAKKYVHKKEDTTV